MPASVGARRRDRDGVEIRGDYQARALESRWATQRFWHAVWHRGTAPRYALITSWTSGPELDAYIAASHGDPHPPTVDLDPQLVDAAQVEMHRRIEERRRAFEAQGIVMEPRADLAP